MTDLIFGLGSWIIQDGNYGEFTQATTAAFALEFHPVTPLLPCARNAKKAHSVTHVLDSAYEIVAQVVHAQNDWWVLDAGVLMYCDGSPPDGARVGAWLHGALVDIGIDPFPYSY